jgi:hypothetical protein
MVIFGPTKAGRAENAVGWSGPLKLLEWIMVVSKFVSQWRGSSVLGSDGPLWNSFGNQRKRMPERGNKYYRLNPTTKRNTVDHHLTW